MLRVTAPAMLGCISMTLPSTWAQDAAKAAAARNGTEKKLEALAIIERKAIVQK